MRESYDEFEKIFSSIMIERRRVVGDPRLLPRFSSTDQELAQLRFMIRAKRRAIADANVQHNQRLTEMQDELAQKREMYAPDHPEVVELESRVASLRQGSQQVKALQAEEKELLAEYGDMGGKSLPFPDEPVPDPYGLERVLMGLLPAVSGEPERGDGAGPAAQPAERAPADPQAHRRGEDGARHRRSAPSSTATRVLMPAEFPRKPIEAQRADHRPGRRVGGAAAGGVRGAGAGRTQRPGAGELAGGAGPGAAGAGGAGSGLRVSSMQSWLGGEAR